MFHIASSLSELTQQLFQQYKWVGPVRTYACGCKACSQQVPGFRRNKAKLWVGCLQRWLTATEGLACMGLPSYADLAAMAQSPMILPQNPSGVLKAQLGNLMHAHTVVFMLMIALVSARPKFRWSVPTSTTYTL